MNEQELKNRTKGFAHRCVNLTYEGIETIDGQEGQKDWKICSDYEGTEIVIVKSFVDLFNIGWKTSPNYEGIERQGAMD